MDTSKPSRLEAVCISEEKIAATKVPRLWSARSLSERWQVSRGLIYRIHKQGRLPGVRLLGVLRFQEEDLLRLLREEGLDVK